MYITGMGCLFHRGRGIAALESALQEGWMPPAVHNDTPLYAVSKELLADKIVLKTLRRADRFSKMATLAAWDAIEDSDTTASCPSRTGLILGTALGPHATTFKFLDDVLEYGDKEVSPTIFSHSVHNASASYMASLLGIRGPCVTMTDFHFSFHQALLLASLWLSDNVCDRVLVGAVDECGQMMEVIASQKLSFAPDGRIQPFTFPTQPETVLGEAAAFFFLEKNNPGNAYARVNRVQLEHSSSIEPEPDLRILDSCGLLANEADYMKYLPENAPVASYTPLSGAVLSRAGLSMATAALSLKNQTFYASPATKNPHGLNISDQSTPGDIARIGCLSLNAYGALQTIQIERPES